MTKKEYEKVCEIIESHIETKWVSFNYESKSISIHGVSMIKEELKDLIKNK